ncbi:DUF1585 domain-containing protein [Myxococcus xanthus]|uniref:DUF1585 domain-containing protein n=1 Tax=Myxococcus xanthus TaxID=34 RepID=A0A7Y4IDS1_MYXXA|nr:DUF1585 domain-containing protein [Myxococcus xanthus]NOJ84269.1 DUF1585 domain-containing protein [Myxococcus xanthus]
MLRVRYLACLAGAALLLALPASAQEEAVCSPVVAKVPLERHLRQLSLDLLGRPPTYEEYQAAQAKGSIGVEDIRAMMTKDEFNARIRNYHRALLRSNLSGSLNNNQNSRVTGNGIATAYGVAGNPATTLRGANGATCDSDIAQDRCLTAEQPDAHAAPLTERPRTKCHDDEGVPLAVSYDYDTNYYACTPLAPTTPDGTAKCSDLLSTSHPKHEYLYFCDQRGSGSGAGAFICEPDPAKTTTRALTVKEMDGAKIKAFKHPNPDSKPALTELKRCTLDLELRSGLKGNYGVQRGCILREGFVNKAAPYWATDKTPESVKVCAIDAQERTHNPWNLASCETSRFSTDRSCGCGVGMRRCETPAITAQDIRDVHSLRVAAFNDEPLRIAESVVQRDEPYFNILTTRRSFMNGTLSEYFRNQQGVGVFNVTTPTAQGAVPAVAYNDTEAWAEYTRDEGHAGVLTTPSYLYRFPTHRARVNHFYEAFLCKTFAPPPGASSPAPEDACNRENNLAVRCGCNYCHATIEPTGAHWGRYAERSAQFLAPDQFPRYDPKCRDCALNGDTNCGGECSQYIMQAYDGDGASSLGLLKTYLYRTADEEQNIEAGPALLVQKMLQSGDLERCTVRRIWTEFLGRPMTAEEQRLYLAPFAQDFARNGHRLKALIERVVTSDAYRRID